MAGGKVYGSSNMTVLLQNKRLPCSPDVFYSVWVPSSDPSLEGSTSSVNFDVANARDATDERHFLRPLDKEEEGGGDDCDMFFHQAGKKRRLTTDQVRFLEKSFEVENKLEPERKIHLANELGLLPRQVAIWFQNRRARFKTKQLEKDYCSLKACYEKLKLDYDNLLKENDNLKNEVNSLKSRLLNEEKGKKNDKGSDDDAVNKSDTETLKPISNIVACENGKGVVTMACKQEDVNSVKSDVFDSDSPHYTDCNHSTFLEPADSSHAFGPEHSDFSQDEEDNLSKSLLPFQFLPKAEDACYDDPTDNSCHFGFPVEDQTFCFWP